MPRCWKTQWPKSATVRLQRIGITYCSLGNEGIESELGGAIVQSLKESPILKKDLDKLDDWNALWQRHGARLPQLIVPLRLLNAGTEYLKTKRSEVPLSLPLEERKILKEVLKIPDDSWKSLDG